MAFRALSGVVGERGVMGSSPSCDIILISLSLIPGGELRHLRVPAERLAWAPQLESTEHDNLESDGALVLHHSRRRRLRPRGVANANQSKTRGAKK